MINNKHYKVLEILNLDEKLYAYNATCNHPLLVAFRYLRDKTNSRDLIDKGKMRPGDIFAFIKRVEEYKSQFTGRSLKHGIMQDKLLQRLRTFANKNLLK